MSSTEEDIIEKITKSFFQVINKTKISKNTRFAAASMFGISFFCGINLFYTFFINRKIDYIQKKLEKHKEENIKETIDKNNSFIQEEIKIINMKLDALIHLQNTHYIRKNNNPFDIDTDFEDQELLDESYSNIPCNNTNKLTFFKIILFKILSDNNLKNIITIIYS